MFDESEEIRILVAGFGGERGGAILKMARHPRWNGEAKIVSGLEYPRHPKLGKKIPLPGGGSIQVDCLDKEYQVPQAILPADVMIIAAPTSLTPIIMEAGINAGMPVVICHGKYSPEQLDEIRRLGKKYRSVLCGPQEVIKDLAADAIHAALWLAKDMPDAQLYNAWDVPELK